MKIKTAWAIQSLVLCFFFNLAFTVVIFYMANRIMEASNEWVSALTGPGAPALQGNVHMALGGLGTLIAQVRGYLPAALAALASVFTLLMWFFLFLAGSRQIRRAGGAGLSRKPEPAANQWTIGS